MLQTLLQSYQNVSNSQLQLFQITNNIGCKRFCKVIKMLAIHNLCVDKDNLQMVANAFAKLSKCQQFTTCVLIRTIFRWLQTLLQSYQNVSNSQLICFAFQQYHGCKRFCKVIKMLAIHNRLNWQTAIRFVANAFAKLSKCQQFTTETHLKSNETQLQTLLQSYQNVSNSQQSLIF